MLNDTELLEVRERHMKRLEALYAGERLERAFVLQGIGGLSGKSPATDPEGWVTEALASLAASAVRGRDQQVFRPFYLEHWFYGVHFVDAVLGARVVPTTQEGAGGWWTECITTPVGRLQVADLSHSAPLQQAMALAVAMRESGVTVPFFTPQVFASPLNVAVNLYGEEFLVALVLESEAVQLNDRAAEDFPQYFAQLREDQIIYLNPTATMTVERALAVSGGRRLVIVADLKEAPTL